MKRNMRPNGDYKPRDQKTKAYPSSQYKKASNKKGSSSAYNSNQYNNEKDNYDSNIKSNTQRYHQFMNITKSEFLQIGNEIFNSKTQDLKIKDLIDKNPDCFNTTKRKVGLIQPENINKQPF